MGITLSVQQDSSANATTKIQNYQQNIISKESTVETAAYSIATAENS